MLRVVSAGDLCTPVVADRNIMNMEKRQEHGVQLLTSSLEEEQPQAPLTGLTRASGN